MDAATRNDRSPCRLLWYSTVPLAQSSSQRTSEFIQPSEPHELFVVPVIESAVSPYEATPDAQRFLVRATARPASQPLTVIVNWPAVLHNPSKMSPQ